MSPPEPPEVICPVPVSPADPTFIAPPLPTEPPLPTLLPPAPFAPPPLPPVTPASLPPPFPHIATCASTAPGLSRVRNGITYWALMSAWVPCGPPISEYASMTVYPQESFHCWWLNG